MGIELWQWIQQIVLLNTYSHLNKLWVISLYTKMDDFPPCLSETSPELWTKISQNMRILRKMLGWGGIMCAEKRGWNHTYSLGNKYNRHISLLINAYLKEKKERKTGREGVRKGTEGKRGRKRQETSKWTTASHLRACHLSRATQALNLNVCSKRPLPIDTGRAIWP